MTDYAVVLAPGAFLSAPDNPAYELGASDFTLEAWVNSPTGGTVVARKATPVRGGGFELEVLHTGEIRLASEWGTRPQLVTRVTPVLDGQWHHVAGVLDGTTLTVYVDGEPVAGRQRNHSGRTRGASALKVGCPADRTTGDFNGVLDEIRVWRVARTREQLQATMYDRLAGDEPGLIAYFTFDYFLGLDYSPVRNDLVPSGDVRYTTPGPPVAMVPHSMFLLLYNGEYHTATRPLDGVVGRWTAAPAFYMTEDARFVFQGRLLNGVRMEGSTVSWEMTEGNRSAGSVTFVMGSSSVFWPEGSQTRNVFEGWVELDGSRRAEFRGRAADAPGPCAYVQCLLNGLVLDGGEGRAGTQVRLRLLADASRQHFCLTEDGCILHMASGLVLTAELTSTEDAAWAPEPSPPRVLLAARAETPNQRWSVSADGHLHCASAPGYAAQPDGANPAPDTGLVMAPVALPAPPAQQWLALSNPMFLANAATGLVMSVDPRTQAVTVAAARDTRTTRQLWYFAGGYLVSRADGRVAAVARQGNRVAVEPLVPAEAGRQRWQLRHGTLANAASGLVMDVEATGGVVVVAPPDPDRASQLWVPGSASAMAMGEDVASGVRPGGGAPAGPAVEIPLQISVKTSNDWFAGFDGEVQITLFSSAKVQRTFTLDRSTTHTDPFERGNIDVFDVTTESLTDLTRVQLHKEQSFIDDTWKVDWVSVRYEAQKTTYWFDFNGTAVSEWASCPLSRVDVPGGAATVKKYPGDSGWLPRGWIEHTFVSVAPDAFPETYFDCAGGHEGTPMDDVVTASGKLTDFVRMATGFDISAEHPWKQVYGHEDVDGKETCGIRASGYESWQGQCHQMVNRLLYAASPAIQLDQVEWSKRPRGYGLGVLGFGPYGRDFTSWCKKARFPVPLTPDAEYVWDYVSSAIHKVKVVLAALPSLQSLVVSLAGTGAGAPDGTAVRSFVTETRKGGVTSEELVTLTNLTPAEIELLEE